MELKSTGQKTPYVSNYSTVAWAFKSVNISYILRKFGKTKIQESLFICVFDVF